MEEIDISQLLNYFKSKIIYILFAMSIAFCLSSIYVNRFRVPEYTSSTTVLLNQSSENASINANDININKSLVTTYREIMKSKMVLRQTIEILDLDIEYEELASQVGVTEITDTSIISISVTDTDPELAADIANTIASVFTKEIVEIYKIENISIIDEAEVSETPTSASTIKIVGIATIAGAFISIVAIFVIFYFDTTIKNEEDIEKITGLPVIGIVPASREKLKYSNHRKYYEDLAKKHRSNEILPVEKEVRKIEVSNVINREKEIGIQVKEKKEPITEKRPSPEEKLQGLKVSPEELDAIIGEAVKSTKEYRMDNKREDIVVRPLETDYGDREKMKVQNSKKNSRRTRADFNIETRSKE